MARLHDHGLACQFSDLYFSLVRASIDDSSKVCLVRWATAAQMDDVFARA
jgi:hypothetical protein